MKPARSNRTKAEIATQFRRAKSLGALEAITEAVQGTAWSVADLFAVGSRETEWMEKYTRVPGDRGNAFSPFQIDKRYFGAWVASGKWRDMGEAAEKAVNVLEQKGRQIEESVGKRINWHTSKGTAMSFVGKPLTPDELRAVTLAAYNSGIAAYHHFSTSGDPDKGTTGADYGADVRGRAEQFAALLAGTEPEKKPPASTGAGAAAVAGTVAVAGGAAALVSTATKPDAVVSTEPVPPHSGFGLVVWLVIGAGVALVVAFVVAMIVTRKGE